MKATFFGKREIQKNIKTEVVKSILKPSVLYGCESSYINPGLMIRFLRKIENKIGRNSVRNEVIKDELNIKPKQLNKN